MKQDRTIKKLTLKKETVKELTQADLRRAAAGAIPSHSFLCRCP
jgi:hypothetical protein